MPVSPLLSQVLDDEALTRGLQDAEARVLIEWLVEEVERLEETGGDAGPEVRRLCRRRGPSLRFVLLWCVRRDRAPLSSSRPSNASPGRSPTTPKPTPAT